MGRVDWRLDGHRAGYATCRCHDLASLPPPLSAQRRLLSEAHQGEEHVGGEDLPQRSQPLTGGKDMITDHISRLSVNEVAAHKARTWQSSGWQPRCGCSLYTGLGNGTCWSISWGRMERAEVRVGEWLEEVR